MVVRLKLELEQDEYSALLKVALEELRNPSDQARFILRQELERRGLLATTDRADSLDQAVKEKGVQDAG